MKARRYRHIAWHSLHAGLSCILAAFVSAPCLAEPQDVTTLPAANVTAEQIFTASGFRGGLIVHAGCTDARLAVAMAETPSALIHGLVRDRDRLGELRKRIRDAGLYDRVSVAPWEGPYLPYADGMVNLLLVSDERVTPDRAEIDRVLTPLGVALI